MNKWLISWSSKRPPAWESVMMNMNQALNSDMTMTTGNLNWHVPVHVDEIPGHLRKPEHNTLRGQLLDQFENEAFKYVLAENNSGELNDHQLIIRDHLTEGKFIVPEGSRYINLDKVEKFLQNYEWVSLGYLLEDITVGYNNRSIPLSLSIYYTRDRDNNIINVETKEKICEFNKIHVVTYANFRKLKDPGINVITLNPHLVSGSGDNGNVNGHMWASLDTYDSGFDDYLLDPKINNAILINKTIFAKDEFSINLYEKSLMFLSTLELPDFPVELETNLKYSVKKNIYNFKLDKEVGYIRFKIHIGDLNKKYNDITTSGISFIEYTVVGE